MEGNTLFPLGVELWGITKHANTELSLGALPLRSGAVWAHGYLHPFGPWIFRRKGSVLFLISSGEKKTRKLPDQLTLTAPISWQATQKRAQGKAFRRFEAILSPQDSQVP